MEIIKKLVEAIEKEIPIMVTHEESGKIKWIIPIVLEIHSNWLCVIDETESRWPTPYYSFTTMDKA